MDICYAAENTETSCSASSLWSRQMEGEEEREGTVVDCDYFLKDFVNRVYCYEFRLIYKSKKYVYTVVVY